MSKYIPKILLVFTSLTVVTRLHAQVILNGGFESGLNGWTTAVQGSGNWFIQSGTVSPISGLPVLVPPGPSFAAMSDSNGPGSHVLFQDFVIPTGIQGASLSFDRLIRNWAGSFSTPPTLDINTTPNQQARIDIMTTSADPFSLNATDVLVNVYRTLPGDPAVSDYTTQTLDLTTFFLSHPGEACRLRFAEVDTSMQFQLGIDNVAITVIPLPEPTVFPAIVLLWGVAGLCWRR